MARIVFLTCHLTGSGHLVRILALARACIDAGHVPTVISGGRPLAHVSTDGIDFVQLPPVTVQGFEFKTLRQIDGRLVTDDHMRQRRERIEACLSAVCPDVLVTELFPFGRRVLAPEFEGAISQARRINPLCRIISSIRDAPEPKQKRLAETAARIESMFDMVMVHGDPRVLPLSATWPLPEQAMCSVFYAGYISRAAPITRQRGDEVLLAVGGGVLGRPLLARGIEAARHSARPWRLLVGGGDAAAIVAELMHQSLPPGLKLEPARSDYADLLARAACSVSLCGYNTAVELALETVPALLIPSEEANEQEQLIRGRAWARHDGVELRRFAKLTAMELAAVADGLADAGPRARMPLWIDSGQRAVDLIEACLDGALTR